MTTFMDKAKWAVVRNGGVVTHERLFYCVIVCYGQSLEAEDKGVVIKYIGHPIEDLTVVVFFQLYPVGISIME